MTREDIKKQFPDATEDQITAILNINGADIDSWKKKVPKKSDYDELVRKAGEYDKLAEKDLTDAEKVQKAIDDANAREADFKKRSNRLEAEKILVGAGLTEEDYKDLIDGIVSDDEEKTKSMASNLAALISKQRESATEKAKEDLMDHTPTPGGGTGGNPDETPEDVKNAQKLDFGSIDKDAQKAQDFYK